MKLNIFHRISICLILLGLAGKILYFSFSEIIICSGLLSLCISLFVKGKKRQTVN